MDFKDKGDGDRAKHSSGDSKDGQIIEKDPAGTAKEEAFATGSESAPPCKTELIRCTDSLDEDTFKVCKEVFRPFKKSLRKLHFPQHIPTEKKVRYMKKSVTSLGDHINWFLQQYCRALEVKAWRKILWNYVALFSEMDAKQLQKLYKYIKNNHMDKVLKLYCSSENPDSFPQLKESKLKQFHTSWVPCRDTSNLQKRLGQEMVTTRTATKALPSKND